MCEAAGVRTWMARAAWLMASVSRLRVAQAGGTVDGTGGTVEPDDGVEVNDAAPLVLSDLGVGEANLRGERLASQPGPARQGPAERDGEPAPKLGGVGVEEDRAGVVVAVGAQWLAEPVVVAGVFLVAGQARRRAGRSGRSGADGSASTRLAPHAPGVDGAERRRGEGDEHARMVGHLGGDAFAAGQPGPDELVGVGPVDLGAGRAPGGPARLAGDRQERRRARARWCSGGSARRWSRRCDRRGHAAARVAGSHRRAGS